MFFFISKFSFAYSQDDFTFFRRWDIQPKSIIVCDDIPLETVQLAVDFWRYYEIINYDIPIEVSSSCDSHFIDGHISVMRPINMDILKYFAMTYHNHKTTAARIGLDLKEKNNTVLMIHELGHALGIDHCDENEKSHVMYYKVLSTSTELGSFSQLSYLLHMTPPK